MTWPALAGRLVPTFVYSMKTLLAVLILCAACSSGRPSEPEPAPVARGDTVRACLTRGGSRDGLKLVPCPDSARFR